MITEEYLITKYVGIPYVHHGRSLTQLDCWGLLILIYKELGYDLIDFTGYEEGWSESGKNYFIENYWKEWKPVSEPRLFDAVLFKNCSGISNHAGVVLKNKRFMHCSKAGVVINKLDDHVWQRQLSGYYRLRANDKN
jgi:cell wall-associated NlpC family hydrolase